MSIVKKAAVAAATAGLVGSGVALAAPANAAPASSSSACARVHWDSVYPTPRDTYFCSPTQWTGNFWGTEYVYSGSHELYFEANDYGTYYWVHLNPGQLGRTWNPNDDVVAVDVVS